MLSPSVCSMCTHFILFSMTLTSFLFCVSKTLCAETIADIGNDHIKTEDLEVTYMEKKLSGKTHGGNPDNSTRQIPEDQSPTIDTETGHTCLQAMEAVAHEVYEGNTRQSSTKEHWYIYVPAITGPVVVSLLGSEFDTVLTIYDRCNGIVLGINDDSGSLQSRWCMDMEAGRSYYICISGFSEVAGYYRMLITPITLPPHDTVQESINISELTSYYGSSDGATCSLESSACGTDDSRDVWYTFVSENPGFVTMQLTGHNFDPTLEVIDQQTGWVLTCNDDADGCSFNSSVSLQVYSNTHYLIRIAGHQGTTGDYTLSIISLVNIWPYKPHSPIPANCAYVDDLYVTLYWNNSFLSTQTPTKTPQSRHKNSSEIELKAIYGNDDRMDEFQIHDADLLEAGDATVIIMDQTSLQPLGNGDYALSMYVTTLAERLDLCPEEPYQDQPSPGFCSGVLIAPDIVATAGHCVGCGDDLNNVAFVFGFVMLDSDTPQQTFVKENVYFGAEIIAAQNGWSDWALIRLDRPVNGHQPVPIRRQGRIPERDPLVVIGHPLGLPRKYDMGGNVKGNDIYLPFFSANLDTFVGSSGSPVFSRNSMVVEGILVQGNEDFEEDTSQGCDVSIICPDTGCPGWEKITRTTQFSSLIPCFDVLLGSTPENMRYVQRDTVITKTTLTDLKPGKTYYWQVIAKNALGQIASAKFLLL